MSISPQAHLLQMQVIHQWFFHYVPRHDFVSGVDNVILDRPYISTDIDKTSLLVYIDCTYPRILAWCLWTPSRAITSMIAYIMWQTTSLRASILSNTLLLMVTGHSDTISAGTCTSTPYSSHTGIRYPYSTPFHTNQKPSTLLNGLGRLTVDWP